MQNATVDKPRSTENINTPEVKADGHITLTKAAFANLLDSFYPNPDDSGDPHNPFGPFGPGGPVMQKWLWAMINPQPLPPGPDPYSRLLWSALNPQPLPPGPDPYRWAFAARALVGRAVAQQQFVELLGDEQAKRGIIIVGGKVAEIIDGWCGTPVPGHHGPLPHALGLLAAGAQFQKAADAMSHSPLQSIFGSAADKLFKAGLASLEGRSAA